VQDQKVGLAKEVELLEEDGTVKKYIMPFKLKNEKIKKVVGKTKFKTRDEERRANRNKLKTFDPVKRDEERRANRKKLVDKSEDNSPMKGKLKPCQKAAAKRKFKVYPSAYANMWASRHKC
jgi:methylmalonyl-CoA mutase N-terminal domain/subunit